MSLVFNMVGGGANLNFSVKQYSANTDLSQITGKENEIAVLTDVAINTWELSYDEPATPVEGMVWVKLAQNSKHSIEALKKNSIHLYINAVFQRISDAWVRKKADIYQNGAWIDLDVYLFNNGDQCVDMTSGWKGDNYGAGGGVTDSTLHLVYSGSGNCFMFTNEKVLLNGYDTLKARYKRNRTDGVLRFGFYQNNRYSYGSRIAYKEVPSGTLGEAIVSLDISQYRNQSHYIGIESGLYSDIDFFEVWLE